MQQTTRENWESKPGESEHKGRARRRFLLGTIAALPAFSALASCLDPARGPAETSDEALAPELAWFAGAVSGDERARRRTLAAARTAAANRHDLERLMRDYASGSELLINGERIVDREQIREVLTVYGLSRNAGGLADTRLRPEQTYLTDDEILVRGYITGRHVGVIAGFTPTNRDVILHYAAFYQFNRSNRLASERLTINLGVLSPNFTPPSA